MIRREFYAGSGTSFEFALTSGGAPVVLTGYTIRFKGRSDLAAKDYLVVIPGGGPVFVTIPYSDIQDDGEKVIKGRWHIVTPTGGYLVSEPEHITIR